MSSQEALQIEELAALNPHSSIYRKTKALEDSAGEKVDGQEEKVGVNPSESQINGEESPSHKNLREHWRQKSKHGNAENAEQNGTTPEDAMKRKQSQRRSRHKKVRTEGRETSSTPNSTVTSQEGGLENIGDAKIHTEEKSNGEAKEVQGSEEEPPKSCTGHCEERYT